MLLVEQGVLWVLPMLWLVLLLSEAGAVLETGCSLEMGPDSRRGTGGGETRLRATGGGHGLSPRDPAACARPLPGRSPAGP